MGSYTRLVSRGHIHCIQVIIKTMSGFCSLAVSKNTDHFSKILLAWNEATYQFLQVTHTNMQYICKKQNYTTLYTDNPIKHSVLLF